MDRRADAGLAALRERVRPEDFRRRTWRQSRRQPHGAEDALAARSRAQAGAAARFHQPVSYLVERLTGDAVMDHGLASTTLVYDLNAADFADDLLGLFGLERRLLPRLARARPSPAD